MEKVCLKFRYYAEFLIFIINYMRFRKNDLNFTKSKILLDNIFPTALLIFPIFRGFLAGTT